MKPSFRIKSVLGNDTDSTEERVREGFLEVATILDEMREQLDELQAWRNSVKDQLL